MLKNVEIFSPGKTKTPHRITDGEYVCKVAPIRVQSFAGLPMYRIGLTQNRVSFSELARFVFIQLL